MDHGHMGDGGVLLQLSCNGSGIGCLVVVEVQDLIVQSGVLRNVFHALTVSAVGSDQ